MSMTMVSTDTTLQDGQDTLVVRFESADVGGAKLVKTYTLRRGEYLIPVTHEVINTGTFAVAPPCIKVMMIIQRFSIFSQRNLPYARKVGSHIHIMSIGITDYMASQ